MGCYNINYDEDWPSQSIKMTDLRSQFDVSFDEYRQIFTHVQSNTPFEIYHVATSVDCRDNNMSSIPVIFESICD